MDRQNCDLQVPHQFQKHLIFPVDGKPISTVVASVGSLRKEIAEAQRQDPELKEIVRYLEKQPLGSITYAKHLKSSLVKRAEHFKLASDGVLVAKLEDELAELHVVPNVRYSRGQRQRTAQRT